MCNLAFATIAAGLDAEQREEFLDELYDRDDWEAQADAMYGELRAKGYPG